MNYTAKINTKKVLGRRTVRYESFDEILADAERLASTKARTLGNWSIGQIYKHLALATNVMLDGAPASAPVPIQWLLRVFMKKRMISATLPAGFQLTKKAAVLIPDETPIDIGLSLLRAATERVKSTSARALHPAFGRCTREEWDAFHFRHCEMHMSFIVPENQTGG